MTPPLLGRWVPGGAVWTSAHGAGYIDEVRLRWAKLELRRV